MLNNYLETPLTRLEQTKTNERKLESESDAAHRLASALAIVYLTITYGLKVQHHSSNQAVFCALLMSIDRKEKKIPEYDALLHKEFPTTIK